MVSSAMGSKPGWILCLYLWSIHTCCLRDGDMDRDQDQYYADTIHTGCVRVKDWTPEGHGYIITTHKQFQDLKKWVHNPFFPVPVQVPVTVQVQCEKFFLKPYSPFFLAQVQVQVPVPVPKITSVNTP